MSEVVMASALLRRRRDEAERERAQLMAEMRRLTTAIEVLTNEATP